MLRPGMPAATAALDSLVDIAKAPDSFVPTEASAKALPALAADRLSQYLALFADRRTLGKSRFYPGLTQRRWHDRNDFAITKALEASFEDIRREVDALDDPDFYHDSEGLVRDGQLENFSFLRTRQEAPGQLRALSGDHRDNRASRRGHPAAGRPHLHFPDGAGTHIVPHVGPTNLRLRSHLGIHVPAGDCRLGIGGETRGWVEGECIVFDDTFEHEAWNFTNEARTVLIVDIGIPT